MFASRPTAQGGVAYLPKLVNHVVDGSSIKQRTMADIVTDALTLGRFRR